MPFGKKKPSTWDKVKGAAKTLGSYNKIRHEKEDEHGRVLAKHLDTLREKLKNLGFQDLSILGEIKKAGQAWGMAKDMPKGQQLHVRAVKDPDQEGHYILGAHLEAHRKRASEHLQGKSDHKKGGKLLRKLLGKTKIFKDWRVRLGGKWWKASVAIDKDLGKNEVKNVYD